MAGEDERLRKENEQHDAARLALLTRIARDAESATPAQLKDLAEAHAWLTAASQAH